MQLTIAILENPKDKTIVRLIYANTTFEDILLKVTLAFHFGFCIYIITPSWIMLNFVQEDLDDFASKFPNRFKVYYVLSQVGLHICFHVTTSYYYYYYY